MIITRSIESKRRRAFQNWVIGMPEYLPSS